MKPNAAPTIWGAVTFAAAQAIWSVGHAYGGWRGAWLLKSGAGIAACFVAFVAVALVVCVYRRKTSAVGTSAMFVALGGIAGLIVAMCIIGPGNLWPIVIAFGGAIIGSGAAVGASLAKLLPRGNAA